MRNFIILITFLATSNLYAQKHKLKMIATLNRMDTLKVQKFDYKGREILMKSFPQYGMNQLLTYTYDDKKITSHIWSHSNVGFAIYEYIYDTNENTRLGYSYAYKPDELKRKIPNLNLCKDEKDLKNLPEYLNLHTPEKRFLKQKVYYKDTTKVKEIEFSPTGDTLSVKHYNYENGLLKSILEKTNNRTNELIYNYDTKGNEIQQMKIFDSQDTFFVSNKIYKNDQLIESLLQVKHEISSTSKYLYVDKMLATSQEFDTNNVLKIQNNYFYKSGHLDKIEGFNRYQNHIIRVFYFYY